MNCTLCNNIYIFAKIFTTRNQQIVRSTLTQDSAFAACNCKKYVTGLRTGPLLLFRKAISGLCDVTKVHTYEDQNETLTTTIAAFFWEIRNLEIQSSLYIDFQKHAAYCSIKCIVTYGENKIYITQSSAKKVICRLQFWKSDEGMLW